MNTREVVDQDGDSRFIEGIFNYCDRWCERCPFTSRCRLYAMEEEDRDDPAAHDINSEAFWEKLASIFKQTHEMIATMAAEQGIDLESIDLEPARAEKDRLREKTKSDPLSQSAERYSKLVNQWFDLEQLRRVTEQKFPMARSFVRPGFDEAPDRFVS